MQSTHPRPRGLRRGLLAGLCALGITATGLVAPTAAFADDVPAPTARYDMSHSGSTLLDVSGNGRNATLSGLTDASFVDAGGDSVLRFQKNGYAALPQGLVTGSDNDFTVEYTVTTATAQAQFGWVIGDGFGSWNTTALGNYVFVNPRSQESSYSNQVLGGIRVKSGSSNGETRIPAGGGLNPGFTTLTLVGSGNALTLYRDGSSIGTVTHSLSMSNIVPTGKTLGYLGRSLYSSDPLLQADVTDVKFWDSSLTPAQVQASMPTAAAKKSTTDGLLRIDLPAILRGSNTSLTAVSANLSLPASADNVPLTWSSSNTAIVSDAGVVTRPSGNSQTVTLTATTGVGTTLAFPVTVLGQGPSADLDAISVPSRVTENLPLPAVGSANGSAVTWTSSDPAAISGTDASYSAPAVGAADPFRGAGVIARPAYGTGDKTVTLTAHATLGGSTVDRTYAVTLAEQARSAPDAGYAAAYFKSDSDEKIYQAATSGNDFFTFSAVNGGAPTISSSSDTRGLRDPFVLRSHFGDKYYMVATDLCISCGTSWGASQSAGSLKIEVWESTDLVHWSRTNGVDTGITVNRPEAGMTWAPEAYWDDALQSYVVFFSSRLYANTAHSNTDKLYSRVFSVLTRDFKTFTYPPNSWQDTGFARIDSTVTKIGDTYYRFTKNEESNAAGTLEAGKDIFLEKSKVLTAPTTSSNWSGDPSTTWQLVDTNMTTPKTSQAGEGPEIIKLNAGDPNNTSGDAYAFLVDNYGSGGYRAFLTTGSAIASSTQTDRLSQRSSWAVRAPGGLPASPRHGAFVSVPQTVLSAMKDWTNVQAVASTTALETTATSASATVTAADAGQVAGTVTFSRGTWTCTVPVTGGRATTDVPAGSGTLTAHYDGYSDGLVSPSSATATPPKRSQTVTLAPIADQVVGAADAPVTASASSGLPVALSTTGPCSIVNGAVHVTGAGTCTVTAAQAGDDVYDAATPVQRSFVATVPLAAPTVVVSSRCAVGKPVLTVQGTNRAGVSVTFDIATPLGSTSVNGVASGKTTSAVFTGRSGSLSAGSVTVTATAKVDGVSTRSTTTAAYPARTCG